MSAQSRTRTRGSREERALVLVGGAQLPVSSAGSADLAVPSHLYFAYGAGLSEPLLRRRCPEARFVGRAALRGFGLAFAAASKTWGGATLTLVPNLGAIRRGHDGPYFRAIARRFRDRFCHCIRVMLGFARCFGALSALSVEGKIAAHRAPPVTAAVQSASRR